MQIVDTTAVQAAITKLPLDDMLELNKFLVEHIKHKRNIASQKMKRQLFVGTKVSFEDNNGWTVQGKIIKVMRKFAQVRGPDQTVWRVPITALTKEVA